MKILAVKDMAIEAYGQPIFVIAIGQGIRSFTDEINRPDSQLNAHPEDYDLYEIGDWNENTGLVTGGQIRLIARGKDVRREG